MVEVAVGIKSGEYVGNGTNQSIIFSSDWKQLTIMSADRKYIMYFIKSEGTTMGSAAIGSGGTYKQLTVTEGGVTGLDNGFSVGSHISINELSRKYFWSVV